ncbi:MAG: adenylate/guanylate cyclase domain-containing protein [Leptospiraceae bacterium]|nr:adenylate/guanylate cyclase domain-containing protein [Leptospiraceae bacterium]
MTAFISKKNSNILKLLQSSRKDKRTIATERKKADDLLLNTLPKINANELKEHGSTKPQHYESATVLFTDFAGFTKIADNMPAEILVQELDHCFSFFDSIIDKYSLEKIKTIGDSYMACGGIPLSNRTHAIDATLAAIEMQAFMARLNSRKVASSLPYWELRVGIHTGPLVAAVIGKMKFQYDIFGDTVNTASRMESTGATGRINISDTTYKSISEYFVCDYRGKIEARNKGMMDMYFVNGIHEHLSMKGEGHLPNSAFHSLYNELARTSSTWNSFDNYAIR